MELAEVLGKDPGPPPTYHVIFRVVADHGRHSCPSYDDDDETWVRNMQQQVRADVRARRDWESLATEEKELVRNFVAAQAVPAGAYTACPLWADLADA